MTRLTVVALLAATVSATAIAGTLAESPALPEAAQTRSQSARGLDEPYVPSVNAVLGTQANGAFVLR